MQSTIIMTLIKVQYLSSEISVTDNKEKYVLNAIHNDIVYIDYNMNIVNTCVRKLQGFKIFSTSISIHFKIQGRRFSQR